MALEQGQPVEAETRVREAREEFRKEKQIDDEMFADTCLARALLAQHWYGEAQKEIEAGKGRWRRVKIVPTGFNSTLRRRNSTLRRTGSKKQDAPDSDTCGGQTDWSLRVSVQGPNRFKIEMKSGKTSAGGAHLDALQEDATSKGFLLIARKAAKERAEH